MLKKKIIHEEQTNLDQTILEIEDIVTHLEHQKRKANDVVEHYVQSSTDNRVNSYSDVKDKPYIGRLDVQDIGKDETYYIGKTGVRKNEIEDLIIDWRAPISDVFYKFHGGNGKVSYNTKEGRRNIIVSRKRDIRIDKRKVIDVGETFSEKFKKQTKYQSPQMIPNDPNTPTSDTPSLSPSPYTDNFLSNYLGDTGSNHQLREIIATIQKEQHEIISLDIKKPIIVQGAAGSGKSSVALHRISYLLYRHKHLRPENIMIIAPNQMFLSYIQNILPDLDISNIKQNTFIGFSKRIIKGLKEIKEPHEFLSEVINSTNDQKKLSNVISYKGSIKFKNIIDRYIDSVEQNYYPEKDISISSEATLSKEKIKEIYDGYANLPVNKRREESIKSILNWLNDQEIIHQEKIEDDHEHIVSQWANSLPKNSDDRKSFFILLDKIKKIKIKSLN